VKTAVVVILPFHEKGTNKERLQAIREEMKARTDDS
jgi:hypothetical protein